VAQTIVGGIIVSQDNTTKVTPFELICGLEVVCRVFEKQVAKHVAILCSIRQTGQVQQQDFDSTHQEADGVKSKKVARSIIRGNIGS
jgi:hypothetical protein